MTFGLDTSVLLRALTGEPRNLALRALRFLRERREAQDRVLVSDWVVAEAYYALQHHYGASKRECLDALRSFLATPGIESHGEAAEVLATPRLETAKPGFIDRLIHRTYLGAGADRLATVEKAAGTLPGTVVLGA